ncbi:MAG TPA: EAL domain-containing protein [Caulobacteraceae bacterium]|jgi:EAL domain-containing protein (putative c-di-GMP-specific phosphodiesterase class I)|nr:EAL domain-containing protein [Caulobacteraceae bacterium]
MAWSTASKPSRGYEEFGCADPLELFDRFVYAEAVVALEELLHQRAIDAFAAHALDDEVRLFLNIDGRALLDKGYDVLERTIEMFSAKGLAPARLCVELSERSERYAAKHVEARLQNLRSRGVRFAADDFGLGHADLKLMYDGAIEFVKIDKYFIKGIFDSERQKVFLSSVCRFAHLLGVRVIAEGVETEAEFAICRDLGCDLVQGWFVDFPQVDLRVIPSAYPHIAEIGMKLRLQHAKSGRESPIAGAMINNEPVRDTDPIEAVFEHFRQYPEMDHCAVVDEAREPRGLISQLSLRPFAYNRLAVICCATRDSSAPWRASSGPAQAWKSNAAPGSARCLHGPSRRARRHRHRGGQVCGAADGRRPAGDGQ